MSTKKENTKAKASFRTPAAIAAAERGEETYVVTLTKRYSNDKSRYLKVDANPDVIIPTEEEVEVAENEYFELMRISALRKSTRKMLEKIVRETADKGAAL